MVGASLVPLETHAALNHQATALEFTVFLTEEEKDATIYFDTAVQQLSTCCFSLTLQYDVMVTRSVRNTKLFSV